MNDDDDDFSHRAIIAQVVSALRAPFFLGQHDDRGEEAISRKRREARGVVSGSEVGSSRRLGFTCKHQK
jgi:hypothetical protein